jgi:hypothetical protein
MTTTATARIIDFGKNKGLILNDCDEKYLKWLVSHEKVLAVRNRWACRDARFILERRAKEAAAQQVAAEKLERIAELAKTSFLAQMDLSMANFIVTKKLDSDLSNKGNLYSNHGFSLLR